MQAISRELVPLPLFLSECSGLSRRPTVGLEGASCLAPAWQLLLKLRVILFCIISVPIFCCRSGYKLKNLISTIWDHFKLALRDVALSHVTFIYTCSLLVYCAVSVVAMQYTRL